MTTEHMLLRDPAVEPTSEVIAAGLGTANTAYVKFVDTALKHGIQIDWRYYRDGNAWLGKGLYKWTTSRGANKEMTVLWLSIWEGYFKAIIYFQEKFRHEVCALPLGNEVLDKINHSNQMGKLKSFPVSFNFSSDELFNDFFTLADYKKTAK